MAPVVFLNIFTFFNFECIGIKDLTVCKSQFSGGSYNVNSN